MPNKQPTHNSNTWRTIKAGLVAIIAIYFFLIFFGNLIDYGSNYSFVQHVLSMDTIFPDSTLRTRALTSQSLWIAAYRLIITIEGISAIICTIAAAKLFIARNNINNYRRAKKRAYRWLFIGFSLFSLGFITIGGEWFAMRQSDTWNWLNAATRNMTMIGIVLIALATSDKD